MEPKNWKSPTWKKSVAGGCLCFLILAALIAISLYVILSGVVKERDHKLPTFHVQQFSISGLEQSLAESMVNTKSSFVIETTNKGQHMDIYYDSFQVTVESQSQRINLGNGTVPGFDQASKSTSFIVGNLTSYPADTPLLADQQRSLLEARNKEFLELTMALRAKTRYTYGKDNKEIPTLTAEVGCRLHINPQIASGSQLLWESCDVLQFDCPTDICH